MALDPDSQTFWQWITMLMFGAPAGYKVVTHESRIKQLEDHRQQDINKLDQVVSDVSGVSSKLDEVADGVKAIQVALIAKGIGKE